MKDAKRRQFINKTVKFLPWAGVGTLLFPAFKLIDDQRESSGFVKVPLSSLIFEINEVKGFFIIKDGDKLKALSSACTHLGCELKFDPLKHKFVCPCHKSEFDTTGKVLKGPATRNLDIANLKIEKNEVIVRL